MNSNTFPKPFRINARKWLGMKYFLMSLVFVALVVAFSYVPIFGWIYAFFDYKVGLKLSQMQFVGLDNFAKLFAQGKDVLRVLRNTMVMSLLGIVTSPLPIVFAIMLNEIGCIRFKKVAQTITTFPNFISWIVVFGLAWAMFSTSGIVTRVQTTLGFSVSETGILGDNTWVWLFQLGLQTWKGLGWSAIIYLAAISGIDTELYDAVKIDGANRLQAIWHVTVPGVIPTYLVLLLLGVSNMLSNGFEQYFVFYNSLVSDRIEVLDYYVYKLGILIGDYPFSIAVGMMKSLISIVLLLLVNWIAKRARGESLV